LTNALLKWTPNGQSETGRPKNTWKKDLEKDMEATGLKYNWKKMETAAQDRA